MQSIFSKWALALNDSCTSSTLKFCPLVLDASVNSFIRIVVRAVSVWERVGLLWLTPRCDTHIRSLLLRFLSRQSDTDLVLNSDAGTLRLTPKTMHLVNSAHYSSQLPPPWVENVCHYIFSRRHMLIFPVQFTWFTDEIHMTSLLFFNVKIHVITRTMLVIKDKLIRNIFLWTPSYGPASFDRPTTIWLLNSQRELNYHDQKILRTPTHDLREHWTTVSTLLGVITNVYRNFHHCRSHQRPQIAVSKLYNWPTSLYCTQVTPNQQLMVIARPNNLNFGKSTDVTCKTHLGYLTAQLPWLVDLASLVCDMN